jgi:hypothetical protein
VLEPHAALAALPCPVYLTTNADGLMARALTDSHRSPQIRSFDWRRYAAAAGKGTNALGKVQEKALERDSKDDTRIKEPLVYHLFGRWERGKPQALTEIDYLESLIGLIDNDSPNLNHVRGVLRNSTLLFLGFRMDDWTFRVLFQLFQDLTRWERDFRSHPALVVVQLDPQRDRTLDPARARAYLKAHCQQAQLRVCEHSLEEFLRILKKEWDAERVQRGL